MNRHWVRQTLALAALFGGHGFIYLWLGQTGLLGAFFGMTVAFCTLGLASGYWMGIDTEADQLVTELMKWLKQKRSS